MWKGLMKNDSRTLLLGLIVSAAAGAGFSARALENDTLSFHFGAGGVITPRTELKSFFGEPLSPGSKVEFGPGGGYTIGAHFPMTDWFAFEAETALLANGIHSMSGASRTDAIFYNVPFFGSIRLQPPGPARLNPYIGGGAGFSALAVNIDQIDLGGTSVKGNESDIVFACQAFGGLRYQINPQMGVGVEYRYVHANAPSWEAENIFGEMRFGAIDSHMITAVFELRF